MALVVEHAGEIVGVGRLSKLPGTHDAEFALLISDLWQNKGLGRKLLSMLLQVARDEKLTHVQADILPENLEMQRLCEKQGFEIIPARSDQPANAAGGSLPLP
jgi:acetyltransferase